MTMPRYGYGYPYWDYPYYFHKLTENGNYFVCVEESTDVSPEGLLRPDGEPVSPETPLGKRPWRFRASGIQTRLFLDAMDRFEPLDHDNITNEQRRRRRDQLIEEFGRTPLPLFDLYANGEDENLPFLRATLTPASWYWIEVRQRREVEDPRLPIFVGAPEIVPGPYLPGSLEFINAVPPFFEYRLRDIFSLAHVPDAGLEEIGGEPAPPPDKPDDESYRAELALRAWKPGYDEGTPSQEYEA